MNELDEHLLFLPLQVRGEDSYVVFGIPTRRLKRCLSEFSYSAREPICISRKEAEQLYAQLKEVLDK